MREAEGRHAGAAWRGGAKRWDGGAGSEKQGSAGARTREGGERTSERFCILVSRVECASEPPYWRAMMSPISSYISASTRLQATPNHAKNKFVGRIVAFSASNA